MKNKKNNYIVIISAIISFIIGISFLICFLSYCNIKLTILIKLGIVLLITIPALYIPERIGEKRKQLINELFIVDIYNKYNSDEHIRITEKKYCLNIKVL